MNQIAKHSITKFDHSTQGTTGMNEITKKEWAPPAADGWNDIADQAEKRLIQGQLVKFNEGKWLLGKEAVEIKEGGRFEARSGAVAWAKWRGGKTVDYRQPKPGMAMPTREELGDDDPSQWELGPDDKPRDPWRLTFFVYLEDPQTAEVFTFSTASWGGRNCVETLAAQTKRMREKHPDAVPMVELRSAPMKTRYGLKSKPVLKVVGWLNTDLDPARVVGPAPKPTPKLSTAKVAEELNDVPF